PSCCCAGAEPRLPCPRRDAALTRRRRRQRRLATALAFERGVLQLAQVRVGVVDGQPLAGEEPALRPQAAVAGLVGITTIEGDDAGDASRGAGVFRVERQRLAVITQGA